MKREEINKITQAVVVETFKALSLLTDELIAKAKEETSTKEEYNAFMRGAAFIFYRVCERTTPPQTKENGLEITLEESILHCEELLPFLTEQEKKEHLQLIGWLNELQEYRAYERPKSPWRDAKKDPPKKELDGQACEFVLVPYENGVREVRYYFSTGTFEKGFLGTSEEEVIYPKVWMPMPELPKGGEQ